MEVQATLRKRQLESDGEWCLARSKRKTKSKPLPTTTTSAPVGQHQEQSVQNRPWFLCSVSEYFPVAYHIVKAMEEKFGLLFEVKPALTGQFLVKSKDNESLWVLSFIKEVDGKPLHFVQKETVSLQKGAVCGFPQEFGLCLLSRLDNICSPMRMKSRAGEETKQVSVFLKGEIPEFIDRGSWGRFAAQPFIPEPLRCYRCQRWDTTNGAARSLPGVGRVGFTCCWALGPESMRGPFRFTLH